MAFNARILSITVGCLLSLAFIFYVVSNVLPEWSKLTAAPILEDKIGLWRTCTSPPNLGQRCVDIKCPLEGVTTNACSQILAARAFVTLACIMSGFSVMVLFVFVATSGNTKQMLLMAGKVLAFACLIMGIIGVALGINVTTDTKRAFEIHLNAGAVAIPVKLGIQWGTSAIIGVIAIVLNFCGAIASVLIK